MKSMNEISIPKSTITPEQYMANARQLIAAVLFQATKDYCDTCSEKSRDTIIKDLRSSRMDYISNGMSIVVAEQLQLHPDEIRARVKKEEEQLCQH